MYSDEEILNYMEQKLREGGTKVSVTYDALGLQVLKSTDENARHSIRRAVSDAIDAEGLVKEDVHPLYPYMAFYKNIFGEIKSIEIKAYSIEDAERRTKGVFGNKVISIKPLP